MRIILLITTTVLLCCMNVSAQKTLSYKETSMSHVFMIDNQTVTFNEFKSILDENPVASKAFMSGRSLKTAGTVIGCAGAFAFGWDLGARAGGGKSSTALLVGGGGVMVAGIIMSLTGDGKMKKALNLYNNPSTDANLAFGFTTTGVGLSMRF